METHHYQQVGFLNVIKLLLELPEQDMARAVLPYRELCVLT